MILDPAKVITDWSKPLLDGGLGPGSASQYLLRLVNLAAERYNIDLKVPFEDLPPKQQHILVYGPPKGEAPRTGFHGILAYLRDTINEARSEGYREYMMTFMSATPCPACRGKRLRPESLAVKINGLSIADFTALPLNRALSAAYEFNFTAREALVADRIRREIIERLEFLCAVGLNYLSLDRNAATLSGGEGQRIRLATQIGSRLRGVLYVLDEPSIGLHQRDNSRLIEALVRLRDLGNTVLVVEHDEDTIRHADYVLDLGPGAGRLGGYVVAQGTPEHIMACPSSLTGRYLSGASGILHRPDPRPLTGKWMTVNGAREHNLQDIDIRIPLGVMTVVTGVSGSGKSTLINDILYRSLAKNLYGSREEPGVHESLDGPGPDRQGHPHRPGAHRPHAALQPRHLHAGLLAHPRPLRHAARGPRARLQAWPLQLQRGRRPMRSLPGRRPAPHRNEFHARRLRTVRSLQRTPLQPGNPRRKIPRPLHRRHPRPHHRRRAHRSR